MRETQETTLGDLRCVTTQFPSMRGLELYVRLFKSIGPVMLALSSVDPGSDLGEHAGKLGSALANLDPRDAVVLVGELLRNTYVWMPDGTRVDLSDNAKIDKVMTGRLPLLLKLLQWVIEANFGNFNAGSDQSDSLTPKASA